MQKGLDRRLQDLERKVAPEGPVTFRLVHHGEHVDDGTPVIRLVWGDNEDTDDTVSGTGTGRAAAAPFCHLPGEFRTW